MNYFTQQTCKDILLFFYFTEDRMDTENPNEMHTQVVVTLADYIEIVQAEWDHQVIYRGQPVEKKLLPNIARANPYQTARLSGRP